jgi:PKD repeat protein
MSAIRRIPRDHAQGPPGRLRGWYYEACSTGFNWLSGRGGVFYGDYFYRAGLSILDAHRLAQAAPPVADFTWSPSAVYPNTDVAFSDLSSGQPTAWTWGFQDATPAIATTKNPVVQFASIGAKSVTLVSENATGFSPPVAKTVSVLDPAPQVQSVSVSPASPLQCQPSLHPNGATGRPTLACLGCQNGGGSTVNTGGGNPYSWNRCHCARAPTPRR